MPPASAVHCRRLSPPPALSLRVRRAGGRRVDLGVYYKSGECGPATAPGVGPKNVVIFAAPLLATVMATSPPEVSMMAAGGIVAPPPAAGPEASRYSGMLAAMAACGFVVVTVDVWPARVAPAPLWRVPALYEATSALVTLVRAGALVEATTGDPLFARCRPRLRVAVVGHSLGGAAAVCCARATPGVYAAVALHPTRCDSFCPAARYFDRPTLFVTGGRDWLVDGAVARGMMQPGLDTEVRVVRAGHADMLGSEVADCPAPPRVRSREGECWVVDARPCPALYARLVVDHLNLHL